MANHVTQIQQQFVTTFAMRPQQYEPLDARDDSAEETLSDSSEVDLDAMPLEQRSSSRLTHRQQTTAILPAASTETLFDDDDDNDDDTSSSQPTSKNSASHGQNVPPLAVQNSRSQNSASSGRPVLAAKADGVFSNIAAKPSVPSAATLQSSPSEEQPPVYESVAGDAVPPYPVVVVETDQLADGTDAINGVPVGKPSIFLASLIFSVAFDIVGFLFTYLFSITHAGKTGARAGLGFTMIKHALLLRYPTPEDDEDVGRAESSFFLSYILMVLGWFIIIQAVAEYLRLRRMEQIMQTESNVVATNSSTA